MGGGYLMIKQKSSEMGVSKKGKSAGLLLQRFFMILLAAVWFIPIYYLIVTTFKNSAGGNTVSVGASKSLGIPELCRCFCKYAVSESIV